jgi:hypothetical protein
MSSLHPYSRSSDTSSLYELLDHAATTGAGADHPSDVANTELHVFYYFGATITLASSLFVIFSYLKVSRHTHEQQRDIAPTQARSTRIATHTECRASTAHPCKRILHRSTSLTRLPLLLLVGPRR